jgi:hypothetical protein
MDRPTRRLTLLVGLVTFVMAVAAIDARATYGARTTADEPQYLLSALSLYQDGDLDIANQLASDAHLPFHEIPVDPQTIDRNGSQISPHDPLLPVMLAPAVGIAGWPGARVLLSAVAAATAMTTMWVAVRRLHITTTTAAIVVTALFATAPLVGYGAQIYPEMPAALAVIVAVAALSGPRTAPTTVLAGAAIVLLPWLAVKYVPVAAGLALWLLVPDWANERRRAIATFVALAVAGVVYLEAHRRIYGGWTVYAAGDHFADGSEFDVVGTQPNLVGRTRRLTGLLIDRGWGLGAWNAGWLLLPTAAAHVSRSSIPNRAWLLATTGLGWATATWIALTMHGWWWPGRQVVVIAPIAVLLLVSFAADHPMVRNLIAVAGALSATVWLWLVVEASTGRRTLVVDFGGTTHPWHRLWTALLPDHLRNAPLDLVLTVGWSALILAPAARLLVRSRRESTTAESAMELV